MCTVWYSNRLCVSYPLIVSKELKIIAKTLVKSLKNEFYLHLHAWFIKYESLKERCKKENKRSYFTFEKYTAINIENTTNRMEGLFKYLKDKLNIDDKLSKKCHLYL